MKSLRSTRPTENLTVLNSDGELRFRENLTVLPGSKYFGFGDGEALRELGAAGLLREKLRHDGHERAPSGIAGSVPPSLTRETNIDLILQAADEIQSEDPNVSRIRRITAQAESMKGSICWGSQWPALLVQKAMVDVAREVGSDDVSHGCTGKGNDLVRFELNVVAVLAPWRECEIRGREDAIEYAKKHNVPVPVTHMKRDCPAPSHFQLDLFLAAFYGVHKAGFHGLLHMALELLFLSFLFDYKGREVDSETTPRSLHVESESGEVYGFVKRRLVKKAIRVDSFDVEAMEIAGSHGHHSKNFCCLLALNGWLSVKDYLTSLCLLVVVLVRLVNVNIAISSHAYIDPLIGLTEWHKVRRRVGWWRGEKDEHKQGLGYEGYKREDIRGELQAEFAVGAYQREDTSRFSYYGFWDSVYGLWGSDIEIRLWWVAGVGGKSSKRGVSEAKFPSSRFGFGEISSPEYAIGSHAYVDPLIGLTGLHRLIMFSSMILSSGALDDSFVSATAIDSEAIADQKKN
ncbi:hypothetical protein RHMOL_Rhmol08G0205100 [Rhododendron molle]|uniref:Uncharacterized protein n=1 Tax=Rhododendron molle TaxID=49168 RepID=A0ACC0MRV6_RHOML|nr:hypothetical protein RHMOL_Rhmol08G0205100 [Rhododendron molle]